MGTVNRPLVNEISDWTDLSPGQPVQVDNGDGQVSRALVDTLFEDGSIIWLRNEPGSRSLHLRDDPLTLYAI